MKTEVFFMSFTATFNSALQRTKLNRTHFCIHMAMCITDSDTYAPQYTTQHGSCINCKHHSLTQSLQVAFSFPRKAGISFVISFPLPTCISSAMIGLTFAKYLLLLTATYLCKQKALLHFHGNSDYLNVPKCHVIHLLHYNLCVTEEFQLGQLQFQVCEISRRKQPCVWQTMSKSIKLARFQFSPPTFPSFVP